MKGRIFTILLILGLSGCQSIYMVNYADVNSVREALKYCDDHGGVKKFGVDGNGRVYVDCVAGFAHEFYKGYEGY